MSESGLSAFNPTTVNDRKNSIEMRRYINIYNQFFKCLKGYQKLESELVGTINSNCLKIPYIFFRS